MATWTYLACDLLTDEVGEELPLAGVSFDRQLNGWGQLKAHLQLGDARWPADRMMPASRPGRTALWVARDRQLVWGGIIWTRNRRTGELSASEFLSYLGRRQIRTNLSYVDHDQLEVARDLVAVAQAVPGGGIGLTSDPSVLSGVKRDRAYLGAERKPYAEAIAELAAVTGGFDHRVDAVGDLDHRAKVLALGYPRLGRSAAEGGLMFELPGNLSDYDWPEDAAETATLADAMGTADGGLQLIGTATAPELEALGFPRLERSDSYSDVTDQGTLNDHASADLASSAGVVVYPKLVVRADADPPLGSYDPGDEAAVRITDAGHPRPAGGGAGMDVVLRILAITCTPGAAGADEKVELTMGGVLTT